MLKRVKKEKISSKKFRKFRKKYEILGGIKVSSKQLSEWGKTGGRPRKWKSEAERKRAERLKKKNNNQQ